MVTLRGMTILTVALHAISDYTVRIPLRARLVKIQVAMTLLML